MAQNTEVIVVGGGYAGVMAANRLTQRDDVTVTLVNPRPAFVERLRLHQLVGGSDDAVVDYGEVLSERVRLVVDTVTRIDAPDRRLALASGDTLGYDYLIYAVGSGSADPAVPGAAEFAYPIATLEDAERLRPALDSAPAGAPVTVVGAGPSGIEVAAELAEAGRAVTLVCGGPLGPYLHPKGRRSVARQLARLGVTVLDGPGTRVTAVTRDAVRLADGRDLLSRITVWTAGFSVPDLAARSGLRTDTLGRLLTDETLTSVDDPRLIAAGDSAAPSDLPYRMGCQSAVQLGPQAAETVLSRIAGKEPVAAQVGFAGQCISLGRRAGIFQFARRDDNAIGLHVGGRPGGRLKEYVVKHTVEQLAYEGRKPGARSMWIKDGKREELLRTKSAKAPARPEQPTARPTGRAA
ncbi:NAD(P)/FAD-dependent oxidoreductase [Streptomyces sp. bgisy159]|uniref:NAD(P)/FAD-dependent oxidoreductase n=1 Tax=Streptomyces sp. bgisy159 TaxID=3413795 RepID=UPI003F4A0B5D